VRARRARTVRARVRAWRGTWVRAYSGTWMRVYSGRAWVRAWSGRARVRVVGEDADDSVVTAQMTVR